MLRWLEELELKHLEFLRTIKAFDTMSGIWNSMSSIQLHSGYAAFARRQASYLTDLRDDARRRYRSASAEAFLNSTEATFVADVTKFREQELLWFNDIVNKG